MAETKPPVVLELVWEHDLVLAGKSGDIRMTLDSAAAAGPSPMQALAFGLARPRSRRKKEERIAAAEAATGSGRLLGLTLGSGGR